MSTVTDPPNVNTGTICNTCGHTAKDRDCSDCGGGVPSPGRQPCTYCLYRTGGVPVITPPPPGPTAPPPEGLSGQDAQTDQ